MSNKKWIPKINEIVYFVHVYSKRGYDEVWYKDVMKLALERKMIFKTEKEAQKRVAELGW